MEHDLSLLWHEEYDNNFLVSLYRLMPNSNYSIRKRLLNELDELSLTCSHELSSVCLTFCHQPLQGCRLNPGGNKFYVAMVPGISCSE